MKIWRRPIVAQPLARVSYLLPCGRNGSRRHNLGGRPRPAALQSAGEGQSPPPPTYDGTPEHRPHRSGHRIARQGSRSGVNSRVNENGRIAARGRRASPEPQKRRSAAARPKAIPAGVVGRVAGSQIVSRHMEQGENRSVTLNIPEGRGAQK